MLGSTLVMGQGEDRFYVCIYLEDGEPIGHRGGLNKEFPPKLKTKKEDFDDDSVPKVKRSGMDEICKQFIEVMMGYLEYVPIILQLAPLLSHQMVQRALTSFLEKNCNSCEREETRIIYELSLQRFAAIRRFEENMLAAASTSRTLPRLLTVGLVASLEYSLNLVMKEIAARYPERIFGEDRKLSVREVLQFQSIEEVRETVINDEIDKAQRDNFESQVDWILGKSKLDPIFDKYPDWPKIIELFERRNLFVHANGIVNEHYLKARAKYKFTSQKEPRLGDELHSGPKYYTASVHHVIHFGAMLLQVVWRKIAPDETKLSDKSIGDLGYELIARGQYKLAIRILEFAKELRNVSDDQRRRMNVVNLANAYKLSGDEKTSFRVLESLDWSAVSPEFKVSVAAIKGNVDDVVLLMKKIGVSGDFPSENYEQWPVFYGVRDDPKFVECFRSIFGVEYVPAARKQAGIAQVLAWAEEQDISPDEDESPKIVESNVKLQPPQGEE